MMHSAKLSFAPEAARAPTTSDFRDLLRAKQSQLIAEHDALIAQRDDDPDVYDETGALLPWLRDPSSDALRHYRRREARITQLAKLIEFAAG